MTIKPDLLISKEEFENRMDNFVTRIKSLPRAQGFDEILIPGEPEERKTEERRGTGIPYNSGSERQSLEGGRASRY
jgi:L-2-hydroxycarboxylate dehydrogenase (NAD+)